MSTLHSGVRPYPELPGVRFIAALSAGEGCGAAGAAPESAAMLDIDTQNVPGGASPSSTVAGPARFAWGKQHFRVRSALRDYLLWAERSESDVFFLTLTSSPDGGGRDRLRKDFQVFRKRLARKLGIEPAQVSYCGVDTLEGYGVLHLLVGVPHRRAGSERFLVSVEWLRAAWVDIHGAKQLRVVPVRRGGGNARRLSNYMVSQYVAGQDALVRLSRSRIEGISARVRKAMYRAVFSNERRWLGWTFYGTHTVEVLRCGVVNWGPAYSLLRGHWRGQFRDAWESFVRTGRAIVFGRDMTLGLCGHFEEI